MAGRWREELPGSAARILLAPGWLVLRPLIALRGLAYDLHWAPAFRLPVPVISIGNLVAGGTGKTPAVKAVCALLAAQGRRPAVLSRGYRGHGGANEEAALVGDVPVICNPDRVAGGHAALAAGADVLVLDDGFQHRRLHRDLDIVLLDATRPWGASSGGRGAVLPLGYLREPPSSLRRAGLVWITRWDQADDRRRAAILAVCARVAPGVPVVHDVRTGARLRPLQGGTAIDVAAWSGGPVVLASGIGHPGGFEDLALRLGLSVAASWRFPDHHHFSQDETDALATQGTLIVTGKDAVKLAALPRPPAAWVLEADHAVADAQPLERLMAQVLART